MVNKALLFGIVGFILGGLVVSTAATLSDDSGTENNMSTVSTTEHNQAANSKLALLKGDEFDKAFIEEMIAHHQGAIDMSKLIDANAKHGELKRLGRDIISAQTKEIDLMKQWQHEWGYTSGPESHSDSAAH